MRVNRVRMRAQQAASRSMHKQELQAVHASIASMREQVAVMTAQVTGTAPQVMPVAPIAVLPQIPAVPVPPVTPQQAREIARQLIAEADAAEASAVAAAQAKAAEAQVAAAQAAASAAASSTLIVKP